MTTPTDPGTAPDNDLEYKEHASEEIDDRDMEALAGNANEGVDLDQVIRHTMYVGWIMGVARNNEVTLRHKGGNLLEVVLPPDVTPTVTLVVPYPPKDWKP